MMSEETKKTEEIKKTEENVKTTTPELPESDLTGVAGGAPSLYPTTATGKHYDEVKIEIR